ncbi:MAG: lipoate--protein ligase family protein [Chthoniobacterales bacterium]
MIFERLRLINDPAPGNGAWNMAVDEMLLASIATPTLRVYRWSEPTVTLGYFEKLAEARALRPGLPLMRRWTGGGLVDHGADWTYTLIIPADHALARNGRSESYVEIHLAIQKIVATTGIALELATAATIAGAGCFARPVPGDLLLDGRKIAGAAQRRTRRGLLHQGSLQSIPMELVSARTFADRLAAEATSIPLTGEERARAAQLVTTRYGRAEWLARF